MITVQKTGKDMMYSSEALRAYLAGLSDGFYTMELVSSKNRSKQQNKYYWSILNIIGDTLGYTKDEIHDYFGIEYRMAEREINGQIVRYMRSTSDMKTKEFGEYLDKIIQFAAEHGIVIPELPQ